MNNNEIKNKLAYYRKVVKNMDNLDLKKEIIREDFEEMSAEIEHMAYTEDKHFCSNLLDWIELVENTDLYDALKSLSVEEQTLISYLYHKNKTQAEMAKHYKVTRRAINKRLTNIIDKIKYFLCKR